jgi:hypothetical protein
LLLRQRLLLWLLRGSRLLLYLDVGTTGQGVPWSSLLRLLLLLLLHLYRLPIRIQHNRTSWLLMGTPGRSRRCLQHLT